ncbi:hypothetical protein IVB12_10285 [Bradyrhizobium sp. 179]|uniref:hypothetical protein n=1 Tax=Bradyrhizobium sp. 179 TaxID=2782648 RepID=UPI001FF9E555|nr:hypothetical protein [Bradyrhizobium sp. 179]MCK1542341.1 hypothetical protein [Bradyrhizobium sp. 179]
MQSKLEKFDPDERSFAPTKLAALATICSRKLQLEDRPYELRIIDLELSSAIGNIEDRTFPDREVPFGSHPGFLIQFASRGTRSSSKREHVPNISGIRTIRGPEGLRI